MYEIPVQKLQPGDKFKTFEGISCVVLRKIYGNNVVKVVSAIDGPFWSKSPYHIVDQCKRDKRTGNLKPVNKYYPARGIRWKFNEATMVFEAIMMENVNQMIDEFEQEQNDYLYRINGVRPIRQSDLKFAPQIIKDNFEDQMLYVHLDVGNPGDNPVYLNGDNCNINPESDSELNIVVVGEFTGDDLVYVNDNVGEMRDF